MKSKANLLIEDKQKKSSLNIEYGNLAFTQSANLKKYGLLSLCFC